jgi:hypothetical protein
VACHPFSTNLIIFFLLSLIVFRCNAEFLFYGGDGTLEASLIAQFPVFIPPLFGFTSDVLRGLGNAIFAVNPYWIPAYFLPLADSDEAGVRWDEASAIQRGKVPPR